MPMKISHHIWHINRDCIWTRVRGFQQTHAPAKKLYILIYIYIFIKTQISFGCHHSIDIQRKKQHIEIKVVVCMFRRLMTNCVHYSWTHSHHTHAAQCVVCAFLSYFSLSPLSHYTGFLLWSVATMVKWFNRPLTHNKHAS